MESNKSDLPLTSMGSSRNKFKISERLKQSAQSPIIKDKKIPWAQNVFSASPPPANE